MNIILINVLMVSTVKTVYFNGLVKINGGLQTIPIIRLNLLYIKVMGESVPVCSFPRKFLQFVNDKLRKQRNCTSHLQSNDIFNQH